MTFNCTSDHQTSDVITLLTNCIHKMLHETTFLDSIFSIAAWTNPSCPEIWSQVVRQPIVLVPDVLRSVLQQQCESGAYVGCFSALCHDHVSPHWHWIHHKEASVPFDVKHCVRIYRPQTCTSHQILVFCYPETVDEYGHYMYYCTCNARLSSGWHEWINVSKVYSYFVLRRLSVYQWVVLIRPQRHHIRLLWCSYFSLFIHFPRVSPAR